MNFILTPKTENVLSPRINGLNGQISGLLERAHHHWSIKIDKLIES
jgi:hypothetical protein